MRLGIAWSFEIIDTTEFGKCRNDEMVNSRKRGPLPRVRPCPPLRKKRQIDKFKPVHNTNKFFYGSSGEAFPRPLKSF